MISIGSSDEERSNIAVESHYLRVKSEAITLGFAMKTSAR